MRIIDTCQVKSVRENLKHVYGDKELVDTPIFKYTPTPCFIDYEENLTELNLNIKDYIEMKGSVWLDRLIRDGIYSEDYLNKMLSK